MRIILAILIFSVFWARAAIILDPDFGWHLRQGEAIVTSGIPKTDPFSYTMPSYPLIIHSWLADSMLAYAFPRLGFIGVGAIVALLATVSLFMQLPLTKSKFETMPLLLAASILLSFIAVRPQVITLFFFSLLLLLLFRKETKWQLFIPFLFIFWTNLHGGFAIGIFVLVLHTLLSAAKSKKVPYQSVLLIAASIFATCVNPYGVLIWKEVWMTLFGSPLGLSIQEWLPAILLVHFSLYFYVVLSVILFLRYWKKLPFEVVGLYVALFLLGFASMRHIPFFVIIALPFMIQSLDWLKKEAARKPYGFQRFQIVHKGFIFIAITILIFQAFFTYRNTLALTEDSYYPKGAIAFLKNDLPKGEILSEYGWGGYLIWKLPEKKVFVDGRMPTWKWAAPNRRESSSAFGDYLALLRGNKRFRDVAEKYTITTALLPVVIQEEGSYSPVLTQIQEAGWKEVYKDEVAVVYQHP